MSDILSSTKIGLKTRFINAWNVFRNRELKQDWMKDGYSDYRPSHRTVYFGGERSIIASAYNRMAMDVASYDIQHVLVDEDDKFVSVIDDGLNRIFGLEANMDQTGRVFVQDIALSLFEDGCVALVPNSWDETIFEDGTKKKVVVGARTGRILDWRRESVQVEAYNEFTGLRQPIWCRKDEICIIQNPFYAVMNEPNGMLKRIMNRLALLDTLTQKSANSKLDLLIQMPYAIRNDKQKKMAEERLNNINEQLRDSPFGIAYFDAVEKVTQLNRPIENNLLAEITYLMGQFFNMLSLNEAIFNGTADEATIRNYFDRTIEPIVIVIVEEVRRKWLSSSARKNGESIKGFHDFLRLIQMADLAKVADSLSRNEIVTPNEMRAALAMKPSNQEGANMLGNRNMPGTSTTTEEVVVEEDDPSAI